MITDTDLRYLRRCVDLAEAALQHGDAPFGTVLVLDGTERWAGHNTETTDADPTAHPEIAVARWASTTLSPAERARAVVYTSGEHCPMCAAAHGWAGLGRIVYAASGRELAQWRQEWGAAPAAVAALAADVVVPGLPLDGPAPELRERLRALHRVAAERSPYCRM